MKNKHYGAEIERGTVVSADAGGCVIRSLDRTGIQSPPIPDLSGEVSAGDTVWFFLFPDGTGAVLAACSAEVTD